MWLFVCCDIMFNFFYWFLLFQASCIERIGGDNGDADGEVVLEKIVHCLISPTFLPQISWTGRGKQKEKKVAFCRLTHLIDLIKVTTMKSDGSFTDAQFKDKLIYGILKRAPSKYGITGKNDDKKKSSTSEPEKPINESPNNQPSQSAPIQQDHLDQFNHYNHTPNGCQPPQSAPTQQQQHQQHHNYHYPPMPYNVYAPATYTPPPTPYTQPNTPYYNNGSSTYFNL